MSQVFRSAVPPTLDGTLWIRRLAAGEKAEVIVYSEQAIGYRFHWSGRRTTACIDPVEECSGCTRGLPVKWKAYLHVGNLAERRQEILEVPESTWRRMSLLACFATHLRGSTLLFKRDGNKRGRISVSELPNYAGQFKLVPAIDPLPTVLKFLGSIGAGHDFRADWAARHLTDPAERARQNSD
jgi:hypothetical protein